MPLQQSIAAFKRNTGSPELREQLRQDIEPLAREILTHALYRPKEAFKCQLTDNQVWELRETYEDRPAVVAEFVIDKVIKRNDFSYQDDAGLKSFAGAQLRMDIKQSFKERQFQGAEISDSVPLKRPKVVGLGGDPACHRSVFDPESNSDSIAACRESRLLEEIGKMIVDKKILLAMYFHYTYNINSASISEDGWVTLAAAAGLSKQVGQAIASLADYSTNIKARWDKFAAQLGRNPDHLRRTVNRKLGEPIDSDCRLFDDVMHQIDKECNENAV